MKFSVVSLFLIYVVIVVGINGDESRPKNKNEHYGIASRQKTTHIAHHGTQSRTSNNHGHHQGSNRNKHHQMSTHQRSGNPRRHCEWVCPGDEVKWSYQRYINASDNTRNWTASGEFSVPDQSSGVQVSENSGTNSGTDGSNQTGNGQGTQKNDEHGSKGKGQENQNKGGQGTQTNDEHGSQGTQNNDEHKSEQGTQTNDEQGSREKGQETQNNDVNGSGQGTQNNGGQGSGEETQTNDEHKSQEKGQGTRNNDGKAQGSQTSGEEHSATDESNLNSNRQKQGQGQSKGQETQINEENHSGTDESNLSGNGQGQRQDQGQWGGIFNNSNEASGLNGGGIFSFFGHLLHGFVNGSEQIADIISNITHRGNGQEGGIHNHSDDTSGQYTGGIFSFFGHLLQGFVNGSRNMMGHEHQFSEEIADIIANITHGGNGQGGGMYHSNDTSGQNGDDIFSFIGHFLQGFVNGSRNVIKYEHQHGEPIANIISNITHGGNKQGEGIFNRSNDSSAQSGNGIFSFFGHLLQGFVNGSRDMMGHDNQIAEHIANGVGSVFGGENGRGGNGGENLQIDNGNIGGTGDGRGGDSANSGGGIGGLGGNGVGTGGSGIVNIGHDGSGFRTNSENEPILGGLLGLSRGRHHDRERHHEKVNSKSSHQKTHTRNGRENINQKSRSSKVKHEHNH